MDKAGDLVEGQSSVSAPMVSGAATIQDSDRLHVGFGIACVTLVYAGLIYLTKPVNWGDTPVYAWQVIAFSGDLGVQSSVLAADRVLSKANTLYY